MPIDTQKIYDLAEAKGKLLVIPECDLDEALESLACGDLPVAAHQIEQLLLCGLPIEFDDPLKD